MNRYILGLCVAVVSGIFNRDSCAQLKVRMESDTLSPAREDLREQVQGTDDLSLFDDSAGTGNAMSFTLRSRLSEDLQTAKGYTSGAYPGSRLKSYQRLTFVQGEHYSGAVLCGKNAGSPRFDDLITGNFTVTGEGPLSKVVIGDYLVESGQGIVLWRSFDYGKGADVVTPAFRKGRGLVPYCSSGGGGFFQGAAVECRFGALSPEVFYSHRSPGASQGTETVAGGRCSWAFSQEDVLGFSCYRSVVVKGTYTAAILKETSESCVPFALDYRLSTGKAVLFGEWALVSGQPGGLSGLALKASNEVAVIASARQYPAGFTSPHGLGFGEGSSTSGEKGIYLGTDIRPVRGVHVSVFFDQYQRSSGASEIRFPSSESDFLVQTEFIPMHRLHAKVRYGKRTPSGVLESRSFRLEAAYAVTGYLDVKTRFDHVYRDPENTREREEGSMVSQGLTVRPTEDISCDVVFVLFNTRSYDTRVTYLESDLEGVRTSSGLYGRGIHYYATVNVRISNALRLSAKYSDLVRYDVTRIGSGADELPSNRDNKMSLQVDAGW